jgi:hypothetical protein
MPGTPVPKPRAAVDRDTLDELVAPPGPIGTGFRERVDERTLAVDGISNEGLSLNTNRYAAMTEPSPPITSAQAESSSGPSERVVALAVVGGSIMTIDGLLETFGGIRLPAQRPLVILAGHLESWPITILPREASVARLDVLSAEPVCHLTRFCVPYAELQPRTAYGHECPLPRSRSVDTD